MKATFTPVNPLGYIAVRCIAKVKFGKRKATRCLREFGYALHYNTFVCPSCKNTDHTLIEVIE